MQSLSMGEIAKLCLDSQSKSLQPEDYTTSSFSNQ